MGVLFVEKTQGLIKGDIDWFQDGTGHQQYFFASKSKLPKKRRI
jgi:hypothetical protein